ncbi:antichymotrypsin-2-like [Epargyreus clarus]|uniref:antichymotrypsin-2-like n=1 Tax=Epargyreus clarus TaxID=520877 RepID=UPI003C2BCD03
MANKVYVNEKYELNENFDVISHDIFKGEVENINFSRNNQSAAEINDWVDEETNHHIKHLIDPSIIDEDSRVILVNALYFKILEMPYIGDNATMVIVLPNEVEGINGLLNKLENLSILDIEIGQMEIQHVEVTIPKFKIETTIDLKEVLQCMNVTKIFNKDAEIPGLLKSQEPLYVSKAIQKACIDVDEEGTEAAAGNAFGVSFLSPIAPPLIRNFVADHPFVLFIKKNDITIFSALYKDPSL